MSLSVPLFFFLSSLKAPRTEAQSERAHKAPRLGMPPEITAARTEAQSARAHKASASEYRPKSRLRVPKRKAHAHQRCPPWNAARNHSTAYRSAKRTRTKGVRLGIPPEITAVRTEAQGTGNRSAEAGFHKKLLTKRVRYDMIISER